MPERLSRRRFVAAGALGVAALAARACWWEPGRLAVSHHALGKPDGRRPPLRLVQLSDLHLRRLGSLHQRVARAVHQLAPDCLVLTGDIVDQPDGLELLHGFLDMLPRIPHAFATLGNWEHWAGLDPVQLADHYQRHGVRLLVNQSVRVEHHGRALLLTGLDDATAGRPDLERALAGHAPERDHVVLAHSPLFRDQLVRHAPPGVAPQVVLSGHTHGGQVQLLGWAPLTPPGSGRYLEGWYRDAWPHLYVSRGIGTSVVPARLGAPPEVALFEWHLRASAPKAAQARWTG